MFSRTKLFLEGAFSGAQNRLTECAVVGAVAVATAFPSVASADLLTDLLTDTSTAIQAASADALTVGGYVVAGVASLIVVGLVITMVRKL